MAKLTTVEFVESIKELSVLELNELVKAIEQEFGVTAAAPMAGGAAAAVDAAPSEVTVMLTSVGGSKINVIKEIKTLLGLGLMDAKKLVDSAPVAIKENISPEEADELKAKIEATGASVEIK